MMHDIEVVIASVPWTDTEAPIMAPAVLKASLSRNNINSYAIDLNAEIRKYIKDRPHKDSIIKFFLTEQVDRPAKNSIKQILDFMCQRILMHNPKWVALSLLTYLSQITSRWLCQRLRQLSPHTRIVIGGPGAFVSLKAGHDYVRHLQRQKLIDHYVSGDAEISFVSLIQGQMDYPGIDSNNWQQISDLNDMPIPNFDDYDWSLYQQRSISIVGSRGCVRDCTFCDIHEHWNKFQWKTGDKIFSEIQHLKTKYGISTFRFADSLVNGNQKEYRRLIAKLANFNQNQTNAEDRIRWTGSFIIRPKNQMKKDEWELTAQSGCVMLSVGVESFVEHIRYHLHKKFTNDDLTYALDMGAEYGIKMILLMIVGYVTETQQDFEQQLAWIESHCHYANNPVHQVQLGSGLGILPGTWLERNKDSLGITINSAEVLQDWSSSLTGTTPAIRMEWHKQMKNKLEICGFKPEYLIDNHMLIESYLNDKYQNIP